MSYCMSRKEFKMIKTEITTEPTLRLTGDMVVGDIAVITEMGCSQQGEIILRYWDGFVSLSSPKNNWGAVTDVEVRILPKGTVVTLTVE